MDEMMMFGGALVGLFVFVFWAMSLHATIKMREDVQTLARCVYQLHQLKMHEHKRALRLRSLLAKGSTARDARNASGVLAARLTRA